jgi:hypothetical protein
MEKFYCEHCRTITDKAGTCEHCGHHVERKILIQVQYQLNNGSHPKED